MPETPTNPVTNMAGTLVYQDTGVLAAHPANLCTTPDGPGMKGLSKSIAARGSWSRC